jgi:hypothetical protein
MKRMKISLLLLLSLLFATSLLAAIGARAGAANSGPIPPSITVSDAVGTNPGTVYTAGQPQRTVNVAWNAGSDYPYCEIYYTVNSANQTELGREHDGVKPLTVTAGSTYAFWMVVYLGAQGQDVRTVANLTVVAKQGDQPSSPPSGSGGGFSDTISIGKDKDRGSVYRNLFAISNVRVEPGARYVIIRFEGPPNQVPYVAIGRAAPIMKNSEWVFGDNLVGGGFVGPGMVSAEQKAKGEYVFASAAGTTISNDGLEMGTTYHYIITIPAGAGRRPYQDIGSFATLREITTVKVVWEKVLVEDDSDDLSTGEIQFWFWANYGQPSQKYSEYYNGDADSGHTYDINRAVIIENAPNLLALVASGHDHDADFDSDDPNPPAPLKGPSGRSGGDENVAKGEFDLTQSPGNNATVPFRLNSMPGGALKFVIFGHFEITRGTAENTGTTSSALTPEPVKAIGRVKTGAPTGPPISICESARRARARNSPAAPGLEAQCRAAGAAGEVPPVKAIGRVKLPPTGAPPRPICDVAREARARNSPAAPGLEAQCRAVGETPPSEAQAIDVNALAAKGEAIANEDPLAVELRNQQPEGPVRRGFDIGMAAAEGQTLPGPGKDRIRDSLSPAEQEGFTTAVSFSLERNRNAKLAATGAAIAKVDPIVAAARTAGRRRLDVLYGLGFDIATGIFGDPALGAQGNTATGPASLKIRDSLSAAGQRGFDASVKLHLSRKYQP